MQDFLELSYSLSSRLYRPDRFGTVTIKVDGAGQPEEMSLLLMEHRPFGAQQHIIRISSAKGLNRQLPEGAYTVVAHAPGYEPQRTHIDVQQGRNVAVPVSLKLSQRTESFGELLSHYGFKRPLNSLRELRVPAGKRLLLHPSTPEVSTDVEYLKLTTIDDVKKVLGVPDSCFAESAARYGSMTPSRSPLTPVERLTPAHRSAMREYIYGNSAHVYEWKATFDQMMLADPINYGTFLFNNVTLDESAELVLTTCGLLCNTLTAAYNSSVIINQDGPYKLEMWHWVALPNPHPIH